MTSNGVGDIQLGLDLEVGSWHGGRYPVILADPPWRYDFSNSRKDAIEARYPTLSLQQIAGMDVAALGHERSVLYLWATNPKLEEALQVMRAWGYTYRTKIDWDKVLIGRGDWTRSVTESLLIGIRPGTAPPPPHARPRSLIRELRTQHSRKPEESYRVIERAFPRHPKIELFARRRRPGWDAWGNEVACDVQLYVPACPTEGQLALEL